MPKMLRRNRQRNAEKSLAKARAKGVHQRRVALRKAIYEAMNIGDYHRARQYHAELHPGRELPFALRPLPTVEAVLVERMETASPSHPLVQELEIPVEEAS